jgi:glycosyltransferase involved in cell wall biosynthesis
MEQTIAPALVEARLLASEHASNPNWEPPRDADPYLPEVAAREKAEWNTAHVILCGSEFVRRGIAECGGPVERCLVVPYGYNRPGPTPPRVKSNPGRLRVLVAGAVGLRKGAPYVLETARALKGIADFRWCGPVGILPNAAKRLSEYVDLRGPVPRPLMLEHYSWADIFLLPSVCEGSATVCYEAMAAGLPVITTPNAGSVVRDGLEGFIVPVGDYEAIQQQILTIHRDRALLVTMSQNAAERAHGFTLEKYGERLLAALTQSTHE